MKCIKNVNTEKIRRVRNDQAKDYTEFGDWKYIPKEEWKAARRKAVEKKAAEKKAAEKKAANDLKESRKKKQRRPRGGKNQHQQKRISND